MATIKTEKLYLDGETVEIKFNCSKSGVFTANMKYEIAEKLGIYTRLSFPSLKELEDVIDTAYIKYKESTKTYKLLIGIAFGASGSFIKDDEGNRYPKFNTNNDHVFFGTVGFSNIKSYIGMEYRVLIQETVCGKNFLFQAERTDKIDKRWGEKDPVIVGDYFIESRSTTHIRGEEKIIDFSYTALSNLESIKNQLRKASFFLIDLITSDDIFTLLDSGEQKLLK